MSELNFRTLDLNLLRVFDEVMTERSLTRAAKNLSITQPAASNALRRLRETLGDDLLRRKGQGLEPTPRGLALWPVVKEALRQLQDALIPPDFVAAQANTTFVLSMADASAAELMPGLVTLLETQAPGVTVRVVPLTTRDPRRLLEDEQADLAIGYFPSVLASLTANAQAGERVAFAHQRLYDSDYVCVMRSGHPLARQTLTLQTYCQARHMLVSFAGRPYGFIDEALAALGQKRQIVLTVNQFFTAGRVVAGSDLLTVLPRHFVNMTGISEQLALRELPFQVQAVHVDALWHQRATRSSAHQWLRSALAGIASQALLASDSALHRPSPQVSPLVLQHTPPPVAYPDSEPMLPSS
jgi:DNA-binding transcriptional LysR family regulator